MMIDESTTSFIELWNEGSLCDVDLRTADGAIVPAHRVVLAAASPFFRALFAGSGTEMKEAGTTVIDLQGVDHTTLRLLLSSVYRNSASAAVTADTVEGLLAAASYLSIPAVRAACCRFLHRELSLANAVDTLLLSHRFDCAGLRCDALQFIQAQMATLLGSPPPVVASLQSLSPSLLQEVLSSDALEVSREAEVAQAAAVWMLGDAAQRAQLAETFLSAARASLSLAECAAAVEAAAASLRVSPSSEQVQTLQNEWQRAALARPAAHSFSCLPRQGSPLGLMVVGGVDEGWRCLKTVELYNPRSDSWQAGPASPIPFNFSTACTLGSCAYVIEGSAHMAAALSYDRREGRWERLPQPPAARINAAAAPLPGGVCVLGGRAGTGRAGTSLRSAELFDPVLRRWKELAPMTSSRASLAACALDGRIYALGGQSDRATHASAEWFDPGANRWIPVEGEMSVPRKYLAAGAVGGQVVAVGGVTAARQRLASAEAYDPREGRWRALPPLPVARSSFAGAVLNGELYVAGGNVGAHSEPYDGVDCLSLAAGKWRRCAPLAAGRSGHAMAPV